LFRNRVGSSTLTLLTHQVTESPLVNIQTLLMSHLKSQINREPVRVMQRERFCARKEFAPNLFGLLNRVIKKLRTSRQGAQETFFLRISNTRNARVVFAQLRIRLLHQLKRGREQFRENRLLNTEQTHRAHRTSHKTTQNIASALV